MQGIFPYLYLNPITHARPNPPHAILILSTVVGAYFTQEKLNVSKNLTIRRVISLAVVAFLASQVFITREPKAFYTGAILSCVVLSQLFMMKRTAQ